MDYSLLLAIEMVEPGYIVNEKSFDKIERRHSFVSSCGKFIYHVAIIDYLQVYNFQKWGESGLKRWILRRPAELISAVEPDFYGDRFIKFMKNEVFLNTIIESQFQI